MKKNAKGKGLNTGYTPLILCQPMKDDNCYLNCQINFPKDGRSSRGRPEYDIYTSCNSKLTV